ncbi:MAG: VOC family protein [Ruoffia tabacinasalis]|uniref:VOC family protein n=1 Tax=Ruoffia sp. FAM 26255 TaxID=3259519 RepID=UPI00388472A6
MTNQMTEPIFDTHQLAFTELFTPVLRDSLEFFTKVLGMTIVHEQGDSIYLRAYEDVYLYSLILTKAKEAGMGFSAFRTSSKPALDRRVAALKEAGVEVEERTDNYGYGTSYRFKDLDGHVLELFWEVEKFKAPERIASSLNNRAQRKPARGVPVRRIDHVNLLTNPANVQKNAEFYRDLLGFNIREGVLNEDGEFFATWLSVSPLVHEVALMGDELGGSGRFHHLAYWYGIPQHLNDLSELCIEHGIPIEAGPLKHGVSQALCMYIIEPGGNRIELFGDSGYLIFDPDWETVEWAPEDAAKAIIWYGGELPETYFRYGTPRIKDETDALNCYYNPIKTSLDKEGFISHLSAEREDNLYNTFNFDIEE